MTSSKAAPLLKEGAQFLITEAYNDATLGKMYKFYIPMENGEHDILDCMEKFMTLDCPVESFTLSNQVDLKINENLTIKAYKK